eukprot:CAMPEP_0172209266 /NCGR_PEP_ID=MMETSP1050-20130122/35010_1 /TAXON_ID=233186 /ORGANISM="Cryptomonas curvata, Strain CCAP979/52" /LENGTH=178 /DNA_ID=CAMNT_0012889105 /DNA_START=15 /DNA_END=548 /DNA_ORIENTATION=+
MTTVIQSGCVPNKTRLVVAFDSPFQIMATETGVDEFFGYTFDEIRGQSIGILQGPRTDSALLQTGIRNAAQFETTSITLILYDRFSHPLQFTVFCAPFHNGSDLPAGCLMMLESTGIPIHGASQHTRDGLEERFGARALVSSEWPNIIQTVSDDFTAMFGLSRSLVVGQSLHAAIGGP